MGWLHGEECKEGLIYNPTQNSYKWIEDLNIKPDALKLIEKTVGNSLGLIDKGKDFLNKTLLVKALIDN